MSENDDYKTLLFRGSFSSTYFGERNSFRSAMLSSDIRKYYPIKTMEDTTEIYVYNEDTGLYEARGVNLLRAKVKNVLAGEYKERYSTATIDDITASTLVKRSVFYPPLNLLALNNGVLDLRNLTLVPYNENMLFIRKHPVNYIPGATCPKWLTFLEQTVPYIDRPFLQEWTGYLFLRQVIWHKAILLVGPTSTGKSTLIFVLSTLLGEDSVNTSPLQDLSDKYQRVNLYQKNLNSFADISPAELKNSSHLKALISGDKTNARYLFKDFFNFIPYAKLIFSCNQVPYVYEDTDAWYKRWRIMNMNLHQYFDGANETKQYLKEELTTPGELSGILNWALGGLKRLIQQKTWTNDAPWEQTRFLWQMHSDPVGQFIASDWIYLAGEGSETREAVYEHFSNWCKHKGIAVMSDSRFSRTINKRYVETEVLTNCSKTITEIVDYMTKDGIIEKEKKKKPRRAWRPIKLDYPRAENEYE